MGAPELVPNLIGGERVEGDARFAVTDPGKPQEIVGYAVDGGVDQVDRAVAAATEAGSSWAATPLTDRIRAVEAGLERYAAASNGIAETLYRENGALVREAAMDVRRSIELAQDLTQRALAHLQPRIDEGDGARDEIRILRKPIGPVGVVVPWNSPMVLATSKVAPALAAGNAVIVKPSPDAPLALTLAMEQIATALPAGVLNVVNSAGAAGPALSAHPGIRKMAFTGSTPVGREVMSAAGRHVKRVSLELGGNDPAILLDDVDLDSAVAALANGVFTRAGQICFGVKRIYVARRRFEEFVDALSAHVDTFVCGYGSDPSSTYGPLISERQRDRVRALIAEAESAGATVRTLGRIDEQAERDGGYYLRPSIVTGIAQSAPLVADEQFGPVIPILPFDDVDEAVALANDSEFGLASSVWSANLDDAAAVAARLEAGCTFINSHNIPSLSFDMPFGGVKQSGLGRERTELGLDEYVELQTIRIPRP